MKHYSYISKFTTRAAKHAISLAALITMMACVSHHIYQISSNSFQHDESCRRYSFAGHDKSIIAVEFTDQGAYYERHQAECALRETASEVDVDEALVVVYAHGWKHNASPSDGNLSSFEKFIEEAAFEEAYKAEKKGKRLPRKVVGIYMGWRGESLNVPLLENLTFWNRKSAAESIGPQAAAEFLLSLERTVNKAKRGGHDVRLVTIGHSFGADVVYAALSQVLVEHIINSKDGNRVTEQTIQGFGDLVVLLNPAFEAARFRVLHELSSQMTPAPAQKPILLVATSTADTATRIFFPIGRTFSELLADRPTESQEHADDYNLAVTAIGHYKPYINHRIVVPYKITPYCAYMSQRNNPVEAKKLRDIFEENDKKYIFSGSGSDFDLVFDNLPKGSVWLPSAVLVPQEPKFVGNPIIVANSTSNLIVDHNDIWNCNFTGFLLEFLNWSLGDAKERPLPKGVYPVNDPMNRLTH